MFNMFGRFFDLISALIEAFEHGVQGLNYLFQIFETTAKIGKVEVDISLKQSDQRLEELLQANGKPPVEPSVIIQA